MNNRLTWLGCLAVLVVSPGLSGAEPESAAPEFTLPVRGTNATVRLAGQKGTIVVLDFFAHWCVPCVRCSSEVETGVSRHYRVGKGNLNGVPVEVFGVNIEAARPDKTDAFVKRTGMDRVLEDPGGKVFQDYGGSGLPYLVIIDATGGKTGNAPPQVIYRKAGFEGAEKLRQIIDSVEAPSPGNTEQATRIAAASPQPKTSPPQKAESGISPMLSGPNMAVLDFATLAASDVLLTDTLLEYQRKGRRAFWAFSLTEGHIGLDYVPETRLENENEVANERVGFQTRGRFAVTERLMLLSGGGVYYGYMDYRSLWLNEHFRQLYSRRPEYQEAHPWGYNTSLGARWEYLPASGFVQGDLAWQQDVIAPGYEVQLLPFPPRLVRFRDDYNTLSGRLTFENALTPRVRAQEEFQIIDTTDRELRYAVQGSLNVAIAEHWVARIAASGTWEAPQFESWSAGATLERDWNDTWFVSLMGRYYKDTGQIENALLPENTASPPLEACQVGLGLRWQGATCTAKLVVGPYFTRYEAPTGANLVFEHLYQNRDWFSAQFAFAHEF